MALLVTGIFYQIAVRDDGPAQDVSTTEIVVAVKDLEIGARIAATDLRLDEWPSSKLPDGVFTSFDELIDRTPIDRILVGEPVLTRRLADVGSGVGLSPKVPEGMRAMSVRVDDVNGVAGFVLPEARVDLLITGQPRDNPEAGQMTRTLLGNVRILAAGEHLSPDASGRPQKVAVVTVLLTPQQAEMITLAQAHGRLQLVLRNSNDPETAETTGVREAELFGGDDPTINVSNPAPPAQRAPRQVVIEPPTPAPIEVEMIRGAERTVQTFVAEDSLRR
jgi:pilus assembly protein CpaB